MNWKGVLVLLGAAMSLTPAARAGTIADPLRAEMDRTAPGTVFSVVVHMAEQAPIPQLNQQLDARKATMLERHRTVLDALQTAAGSQAPLKAELDSSMRTGEILGYTSYWISNMIVVQGTKEAIQQIAARADVDYVEPNFTTSLITPVQMEIHELDSQANDGLDGPRGIGVTPGLRAIRAPEVWHELGINGTGVLVANLDTGVDGNHPALRDRWRGVGGQHPWQECWLDVLGTGTTFPTDTYGHGTHVMGTITGLGVATVDTVGVAWGAQWIATNAINQGVGPGFDSDILTCLQWLSDPDGNPNTIEDVPDVVQNSWRIAEWFGYGYTDCDSRWWAAIDNCEAAGVVTTWSAGNEGPGGTSIGSPADRAATPYNTFSVGAVDATNYQWPYPVAGFSSRGPTGCNVPPELKIKPEIMAPGVHVYSSIPGGGYSANWDGTSMAGPHIAGVVGLMRQANPNLSVDEVKQILMETSRDEGTTGEDNTYGWGFVDAYAAVSAVLAGNAQINGHVRNGSYQNTPLFQAEVRLVEAGSVFTTDQTGYYEGTAQADTYTIEASYPGFETQSTQVTLISGAPVVQDFALVDNAGPAITNVSDPKTSTDTVGPYTIRAAITDPSTVASAQIYYRVNGGEWVPVAMTSGLSYSGDIPGQAAGSTIDFYVWAQDGAGLTSSSPADAPASYYTILITQSVLFDDAEIDGGWSLSAPGDDAVSGLWVRDDPVGTVYNGAPVQPENDHTPAPGHICFVTGNANPGDNPTTNDVDNGCTTLTSPAFDLSGAERGFVTYWRWFGQYVSVDDNFQIDGSSDGGATWVPLEQIPGNAASWQRSSVELSAALDLTNNMKVRFRACDQGAGGLVEAAVDDFTIESFQPNVAGAEEGGLSMRPALAQNEPNPFNPVTKIQFTLSNGGDARLEVYDAAGRLIRVLQDGPMMAGTHTVLWNGLDDQGRAVGSGVYFYRLKAGAFEQSRRMTILK